MRPNLVYLISKTQRRHRGDRDREGEHSDRRHADFAEHQGAAAERIDDLARLRPPDDQGSILEEDRQADGDQGGAQNIGIAQRAEEHPLEHKSDDRDQYDGDRQRDKIAQVEFGRRAYGHVSA